MKQMLPEVSYNLQSLICKAFIIQFFLFALELFIKNVSLGCLSHGFVIIFLLYCIMIGKNLLDPF